MKSRSPSPNSVCSPIKLQKAMPTPRLLTICLMLLPALAAALAAEPAGLGGKAAPGVADPAASLAAYEAPEWQLAWSDEFDREGRPDPTKWTYEHGLVRNGEAQFYTRDRPENARVADGQLIITARKEPWKNAKYISASLTTQGKFSFTYGKLEIRARVPAGRGTWPALWTLGENADWPRCGEIDLMEYVGMIPEKLHFTVHTEAFNHVKKTQKGTNIDISKPWTEFYRFGLIWTADKLEWFLDGELVFTFVNSGQGVTEWPFDAPQYLIMNLAMGGGWGGQKGIDDTCLPAEFVIDYVRVWQKPH